MEQGKKYQIGEYISVTGLKYYYLEKYNAGCGQFFSVGDTYSTPEYLNEFIELERLRELLNQQRKEKTTWKTNTPKDSLSDSETQVSLMTLASRL